MPGLSSFSSAQQGSFTSRQGVKQIQPGVEKINSIRTDAVKIDSPQNRSWIKYDMQAWVQYFIG
jgi:hypothetical protein